VGRLLALVDQQLAQLGIEPRRVGRPAERPAALDRRGLHAVEADALAARARALTALLEVALHLGQPRTEALILN
jgi:hypothetical protein